MKRILTGQLRLALGIIGVLLVSLLSATAQATSPQQDIEGGALLIFGRSPNPTANQKQSQSSVSDKVEDALALGNAARDRKPPDLQSAEMAYRLAWKLNPGDPRPYIGLGNVYMDQRNYTEAAKAYQEAIRLGTPTSTGDRTIGFGTIESARNPLGQWHANLGASLLADRNFRRAERELRNAIVAEPRKAEWRAGLGYSLSMQGRFTEAVAAYNLATNLQPNNDDYKRLLSDAQTRAAQSSAADSATTKTLENTTWETDFLRASVKGTCKLRVSHIQCTLSDDELQYSELIWKVEDGLLMLIRPATEDRLCVGTPGEKEIQFKCFVNDVETTRVWRRR